MMSQDTAGNLPARASSSNCVAVTGAIPLSYRGSPGLLR
ncbi:Uncharacterised protein [Mycobacteroides abscessus subsp. abscessus]|nr:Uncharacterised protein [Mycobacteroides abscessus subsp. abscessus]